MSTLPWLDYSEEQRQKMLDVVSLFREKETRDELAIAIIRDAFADILSGRLLPNPPSAHFRSGCESLGRRKLDH